MGKAKHPVTRAIRALRAAKVAFEPALYDYVPRGGTRASAEALGVDEVVELAADGHALRQRGEADAAFELVGDVMGSGLAVDGGAIHKANRRKKK